MDQLPFAASINYHNIMKVLLAIMVLCRFCLSPVVSVSWTTSPEIQCGSTTVSLPNSNPQTSYYTVTFSPAFSNNPYVALSTVGLQVDPSVTQLSYRNNIANAATDISTTFYKGRVYCNTNINTNFQNTISFLAVNRNVFPNIYINWFNYYFNNLTSGSGYRRDSTIVTVTGSPININNDNSYIMFMSGLDATITSSYDLNVWTVPVSGSTTKFNFSAESQGNGLFTYMQNYRVVFVNTPSVQASNGSLYGYKSQQVNQLSSIQYLQNLFIGLVGFNFKGTSGVQFDLSSDMTAILTNYTFTNLTYMYFYFNIKNTCQTGDLDCQNCDIGYIWNTTAAQCAVICGDGKVFSQQCDDGNTVSGDGCSSTCTIEDYYGCLYGASMVMSSCYPNYSLKQESVSITSDSNIVTFTLSIWPPITTFALGLPNFSINTSSLVLMSLVYSGGQVIITVTNNTPVQTTPVSITYQGQPNPVFSGSSSTDLAIKATGSSSTINSNQLQNGITISAKVIMYLFLITFVLGLFGNKLIAVEMISVIQIAFYSLVSVPNPNSSMLGLMSMQYVSGYYCSLNEESLLPNRYSNIGLSSNFLNDFNVMIASFLLCPILGFGLYIGSKKSKTNKMNKRLYVLYKESVCELLFSVCIFNAMSATIALLLNLQYMTYSAAGIIIGVIVVVGILLNVALFWVFRLDFRQFRQEFSNELRPKVYPLILVGQNLLIAVMMGVQAHIGYTIYVALAVEIGFLVYMGITRPYIAYQNFIRQLINLVCTTLILGLYAYCGEASRNSVSSEPFTLYVPVIVLVILTGVLCMNLGFIAKHILYQNILPMIEDLKQEKLINKDVKTTRIEHFDPMLPDPMLPDPIAQIEMQMMETLKKKKQEQQNRPRLDLSNMGISSNNNKEVSIEAIVQVDKEPENKMIQKLEYLNLNFR